MTDFSPEAPSRCAAARPAGPAPTTIASGALISRPRIANPTPAATPRRLRARLHGSKMRERGNPAGATPRPRREVRDLSFASRGLPARMSLAEIKVLAPQWGDVRSLSAV